jgi:hypothetical protein
VWFLPEHAERGLVGAIQSVTAAATRILTKRKGGVYSTNNGSAAVAWDLFDTVPEVGTYADWVSNAMSGARLFAGVSQPDGTVKPLPDDSRAAQLVSSIAGGMDGQSVLLGDFGTNLAVAGEAWLIITPDVDSDTFAGDHWVVLSTEEVKVQRGKIKATIDGDEIDIPEYDPDGPEQLDAPVAIRVWKQSPRKREWATSPVIRSIAVLEELRLLNAAVAAIARSRITGRGVLLIPAGTRFPAQTGQEQAEDSLLDTFIEVASTAIREPESAAATVPIVLEVPGDLIQSVKWLQFSSEFDALALQLRDEAIRRFATGADVPAEVLLGLGDTNHWGAWAITAEALKMGAEPRLGLVCQALTSEWLQPLLAAENDPDAAGVVVWYDTSGLRSSSNKSAAAIEAYKEGLISDEAARRELGFAEADAPSAPPEPGVGTDPGEGGGLPVNETQSVPSDGAVDQATAASLTQLRLKPGAGDRAAALTAAVDGIVWAALAAAGRKIMRTPACPRPDRGAARELATAASVHTKHPVATRDDVAAWRLLDDAWVRVPEISCRYGVDGEALTAALDEYATALLITGQPHTYDHVVRMLAQTGLVPSTLLGMVAR